MNVSVKPPLASKNRACSTTSRLNKSQILGKQGEDQAIDWLSKHGYRLLARNVRAKWGELDLVVWDGSSREVVFVEVKTRRSEYSGQPVEAVSRLKWLRWQKTAVGYIQARQVTFDWRFDIISIWQNQIEHFKDISWYM